MRELFNLIMSHLQNVFAQFEALIFIPVALLLFGIYFFFLRRQSHSLKGPWANRYGAPLHFPNFIRGAQLWPCIFQGIAVILALLALARPQWGNISQEQMSNSLDLVLAVDVSNSMLAEDLAPNRLDRTKASIARLLDRLGPDRVALIAFAGQAYTILPFTPDHGAVNLFLAGVDTSTITMQGTDLHAVVEETIRLFKGKAPGSEEDRVLIVFTDGEDTGSGETEIARLPDLGIRVFAVGVGTLKGVPIPMRDDRGKLLNYKKDSKGEIVTTKLNEKLLNDIATKGLGKYLVLTQTGEEMDDLARHLAELSRAKQKSQTRIQREDRFGIFLALACIAWVLQYLPLLFRQKTKSLFGRVGSIIMALSLSSGWAVATASVVGFRSREVHAAASTDLQAWSKNRKGVKNFKAQKLEEAVQGFLGAQDEATAPESRQKIQFNVGRTLLEKGDTEGAKRAFTQALDGPDSETKARSQFSLGNMASQEKNWAEALKSYRGSVEELAHLKAAPEWSRDLSHNIQWALRQQSEQKDQKQDQKDQDKKGDKNQDQKKEQDPKEGEDSENSKKDSESKNPKQDQADEKEKNEQDKKGSAGRQQKPPQNFESQDLSPQDARQILNALMEHEKEALKAHIQEDQKKKNRAIRPEKDW